MKKSVTKFLPLLFTLMASALFGGCSVWERESDEFIWPPREEVQVDASDWDEVYSSSPAKQEGRS